MMDSEQQTPLDFDAVEDTSTFVSTSEESSSEDDMSVFKFKSGSRCANFFEYGF